MAKTFNLSYGELTQRADHVDTLYTRDSLLFASMGYDDQYRIELKNKVEYFRSLPSDTYWQGQQMLKTDEKNSLAAQLMDKIVDLRFRCKLTFGADSVEYRSFRFSKLRNIKEENLIIYANHAVAAATNLLPQLEQRQVTEQMLASITETANALDVAIDEQKNMISMRESKTFEREEKANEIYTIISEICEVGKKLWEDKNESYYNDYVIYGSQTPLNVEN